MDEIIHSLNYILIRSKDSNLTKMKIKYVINCRTCYYMTELFILKDFNIVYYNKSGLKVT